MEIKLLSCPLCLKPHFEDVDSLRSTLITVATSHLSCPVCNESLLGLDKLTIHLFCHITRSNVNNTGDSDANIVRNQATVHAVSNNIDNNNKVVTEGVTSHSFDQPRENINIKANTSQHTETGVEDTTNYERNFEQNDEEDMPRCDLCNFHFTDKSILDMHQKLLHQSIPDENTGLCNYHCHLCSKKFKKRGSLMVHLRVAHYSYSHQNNAFSKAVDFSESNAARIKTDDCDTKMVKQMNGQKTNDNKQWECDVCSKLFTTKYFLKKHKRLHTGEMPYSCAQCNKSFTFQQSYHKHMLYHSSEKPYVCNECGRAFKELSTLQNHARIHSGERPFVCETCGKRFRQRVSYLVHRRIHTGVMPYKCTACDKNFRYKVSQRSHKCPASPPGTVVRSPEVNFDGISSLSPDCLEHHATGVAFLAAPSLGDASHGDIQKESIILNNNERIHITYNRCDLRSVLQDGNEDVANCESRGKGVDMEDSNAPPVGIPEMQDEGSPDLFSILSPLLPEVESLCLSNNSPVQDNCDTSMGTNNEMITTMNEESLKELIYGVFNKCD